MTLIEDFVQDAANGVRLSDTPEGLSAIQEPDCAATIWQRCPLPEFQSWIDALAPEQLPKARIVLRPEQIRDAIFHICDAAGTPNCTDRVRLIDDTAALADIFAKLMRAPYVRLRFDVVTNNACRKFHIDAVTARLVCTYRGTGTQYGISTDGAEPSQIFTVPTGAPILMRGTLWPEKPSSGLLHRSPPIEGTSETRLLLVLDPIFDPDGQPEQIFMH